MNRLHGALAALLSGCLVLSACATNPATGRRDFAAFMPPAEEARIGREEHPKILRRFGGAYADPALARYVSGLGRLLASTSELPRLDWTFTVLNSPTVNAFALPGGYVYVTRGLLALAEDEAELAAVIAHEIAHVAARHSAQRYSRGALARLGSLAAAALGGRSAADAASSVAAIYLAGYSRGQEHEADQLGVRYLARSGHDPAAMSRFLAKLDARKTLMDGIERRDGRGGTSLLSTHPPTPERIARSRALAAGAGGAGRIRAREIYLGKIDGMIHGDDPKQGFARGRDFLHPALGFRFRAPPGFSIVNAPLAVAAVGPRGARIVFDRAPRPASGSMRAYLTRVWGARVRLSGVETIDVNGMEAATGAARLRASRDARAVAIRWDGATIYRFLFLAPPALMRALEAEFRRTTYSFRRLAAGEAAGLKPPRLRIRRVRPGDTIASLARAMPYETFRRERLLVLNGLAAGARLVPGRLIKTVAE